MRAWAPTDSLGSMKTHCQQIVAEILALLYIASKQVAAEALLQRCSNLTPVRNP